MLNREDHNVKNLASDMPASAQMTGLAQGYLPTNNRQALDYYISMLADQTTTLPDLSVKKWNKRAEAWKKKDAKEGDKNLRVDHALDLLMEKNILHPEAKVVDIGCGPAKFVAAFSEKTGHVLGIDLSDKMIEHGKIYLKEQGITNADLKIADFTKLDIDEEGYRGAFDLAFSSMTPAIQDIKGLWKMMKMSRAYCCNVTHVGHENSLQTQIMADLFQRPVPARWSGRWFYALFNILFLLGYSPETSFSTRHREEWIEPSEDYAKLFMDQMLREEDHSNEIKKKIVGWMEDNANDDGLLLEVRDTTYGTTLWDVRKRVDRPEYKKMM